MNEETTRWQEAADRARERGGLLLLSDCRELGIPARTAYDAVARRGWQRLYPGVFAMPGVAVTPPMRALAAAWSLPAPAVGAGWTAAAAHGLVHRMPSVPELLTDPRTARRRRQGCTLRGASYFDEVATVEVDGLPCLAPEWTLVDMAGSTERAFLRGLLIDARQRGLCELDDVDAARRKRPNAPGHGQLAQLLWDLDPERCDSVLEDWARREIAATDLPAPAPEPVPVRLPHRTLHLDVGWPELHAGVECDGLGSHSSRAHLETDQRRHNAFVMGGWRVLRVSWWRLEKDLRGFIRDLRQLLEAAMGV